MSKIAAAIRDEMVQGVNKKNLSNADVQTAKEMLKKWDALPRISKDTEVKRIEEVVPGFTSYLLTLQSMALFSEVMRYHPLLSQLNALFTEAEGRYGFEAEDSIINPAYINMWEFFDARYGKEEETLGKLYLELIDQIKPPEFMAKCVSACCSSRMGIYEHMGKKGQLTVLQDLATGASYPTINPNGYAGRKGEIWYVRLLPTTNEEFYFAITTPYIVKRTTRDSWREFFVKAGVKVGSMQAESGAKKLMKYPEEPFYWFDYINEANVGVIDDRALALQGLPKGGSASSKIALKKKGKS